ncbi:hypothetical protein JR316_0004304 [Psilocybe cubensis]|uniref:Uncharacterized protein n=1 Tax=Psilocybe cubensis TaxID=181762 RepID=A0ACB8H4R1_PSICU|nr:hypothetical protein JR316_0004304 [Psilocybe cubensis]KAH9482209.1 hypothetical protein JR316_0004304 [Psilocybe cubensis]
MSSTPPPPPPPPPEFIINRFSSKPNDNRAPPLTDHGTISNRSITQPKRARKPQASGSMNQNITSGGPSKRNKPNRAQQPAKKGKAKARATRFPTETPGSSSQQFDGTLQVLSNPNEPEVPQQYVVPHQQNPNQAMPLTRHSYTVEPVSITETNGNISTLIGQIEQESNATLIYRERWQRLNNSPFPESIQNITLTDNMHLDLHRVLGPMIMSSFLIVSDCRHNNLNTGEAYTRRASTFFPYFWDVSINQLTCLTWEYVLSFELLGYEAPETPLKWIMTPRGSVIRIYDLCKVDPVLYAVRPYLLQPL